MSFEKERYIVFVIAVSILAFWLSAEGQAEELLFLVFCTGDAEIWTVICR